MFYLISLKFFCRPFISFFIASLIFCPLIPNKRQKKPTCRFFWPKNWSLDPKPNFLDFFALKTVLNLLKIFKNTFI